MEKQFLLPHQYKKAGWIAICSGIGFFFLIVLGTGLFAPWDDILQIGSKNQMIRAAKEFFSYGPFLLTVLTILFIGGMLLVALSKEKIEDEFIVKLRKNAFFNAVLYNYILLVLLYFCLPNPIFIKFFAYSIFNVLLMYILDFHIRLNYQDTIEEIETVLKQSHNAK
jgi:hypothetical protein